MRIFGLTILAVVVLVSASPQMIYWWGLKNLNQKPLPAQVMLTAQKEHEIWQSEGGTGQPKLKKVNPYGYIGYIYCNTTAERNTQECESRYPGLRLSSLSVRMQVGEQVKGRGNTVWQITWMAYTLWVTRNWDIHQVLATYHESRST